MNPDDISVEVCGIVKYDTFPYYNVLKGQLKSDGSFFVSGIGTFRDQNLFRIFPVACYEREDKKFEAVRREYSEKEKQLKLDVIKQNNVDFGQYK